MYFSGYDQCCTKNLLISVLLKYLMNVLLGQEKHVTSRIIFLYMKKTLGYTLTIGRPLRKWLNVYLQYNNLGQTYRYKHNFILIKK